MPAVLSAGRAECFRVALLAVTLLINAVFGPRAIPELRLHLILRGRYDAQVMFGMLKVTFGRNRIAAALRVACELEIAVGDVLGRAAHLHVGSVRFVGARQRIRTTPVATPHALV